MSDKSENNSELICVIPAAGKSSRFKKSNKIFEPIDDDLYALLIIASALMGIGVVNKILVGYDEKSEEIRDFIELIKSSQDDSNEDNIAFEKFDFVKGGNTRQETVNNCLKYIKKINKNRENTWILVHDAARPCLSIYDFLKFINKTIDCNTSSIMAMPISDTIKKVDSDFKISSTVSRENMWVAQTPQMFKFDVLYESLNHCIDNNISVTDESQALEILGHTCRVHIGPPHNIKITHDTDMPLVKCICNHVVDYSIEAQDYEIEEYNDED